MHKIFSNRSPVFFLYYLFLSFFIASVTHAVELYNATAGTPPDEQDWKRLYYADPSSDDDKAEVSVSNGLLSFDTLTNRTFELSDGYFSKTPLDNVPELPDLGSFVALLPEDLVDDYLKLQENLDNLSKPDHPDVPDLDRNSGFVVRFTLRIVGENHAVRDDNNDNIDDRAGFSLIIVCNDQQAIELGFWDNEVWAYEAPETADGFFTHAEGQTFDTSGELRSYELTIQGDSYTLTAPNAGGEALSLTGPLRDYTIWQGIDLLETVDLSSIPPQVLLLLDLPEQITVQPYQITNLVFFGDDTSSAQSNIELGSFSIEPVAGATDSIFEDQFELTQN